MEEQIKLIKELCRGYIDGCELRQSEFSTSREDDEVENNKIKSVIKLTKDIFDVEIKQDIY